MNKLILILVVAAAVLVLLSGCVQPLSEGNGETAGTGDETGTTATTATLNIYIKDASSGNPIEAAVVIVFDDFESTSFEDAKYCNTDSKGLCSFSLTASTYIVGALKEGYEDDSKYETVELVAGQIKTLTLLRKKLDYGGKGLLRACANDAETGEMLASAGVIVGKSDSTDIADTVSCTTDTSGCCDLPLLTPGEYNVGYIKEGYDPYQYGTTTIEADKGKTIAVPLRKI